MEEYKKRLESVVIEKGRIEKIEFCPFEKSPETNGITMRDLPERCVVTVKLYPTPQSDITCVVALPLANWNGRLLFTGNGGQAGTIIWDRVNAGVSRYFATANTDMGGVTDYHLFINAPERWKDFGYRGTHVSAVVARQITEAFYGEKVKKRYYIGCSTGGQQAMSEAQRYPEDFDGIICFSPACNRARLHHSFIWMMKVFSKGEAYTFTLDEMKKVYDRLIELYGEQSGSAKGDKFLTYPGKTDFDPDNLEEIFAPLHLRPEQIQTLKDIYTGPKDPVTNEQITVPLPIGCEKMTAVIPTYLKFFDLGLNFVPHWLWGDDLDCTKFDFHNDYEKMKATFSEDLDAMNPDLSSLRDLGHKMVLITGSSDSLIPYTDGKAYYQSVCDFFGGYEKVVPFFKYFHIAGLGHGSGGDGFIEVGENGGLPSRPLDREHDILEAMIAWVEEGIDLDVIYPSAYEDNDLKKKSIFTRPFFPYPYETEFLGGDRTKKENFRKKLGNGIY